MQEEMEPPPYSTLPSQETPPAYPACDLPAFHCVVPQQEDSPQDIEPQVTDSIDSPWEMFAGVELLHVIQAS